MPTDVCNHVKVVVRVRPFNKNEKALDTRKVVHVVDHHMLTFDPKENQELSFGAHKVQTRGLRRANKDLKFVFDNVFGEDSTQVEVFENTTKAVLEGFMSGFNCTVFAYGATGAGKTHTMMGSAEDPGVMYRTMREMFTLMDQVKEEKDFDIAFSYLEVYNEQIRDLMANVGPLAVREDDSQKVVVQGLSLHRPTCADDIVKALDYGNRNRTQHPTEMNATSSRSHAVFQIYLKQKDKTASPNPYIWEAKMSLIDLAGLESNAVADQAKGPGKCQQESATINRSLLTLWAVLNGLADRRDSKLTRLLKDSLGGNCRTVMIANVSPSSRMYDDTHNTLKYADRAKQIKSSLKSNVLNLNSHVSQYAVICEKQQAEIVKLKQKLSEYEGRETRILGPGNSVVSSQKQDVFTRVSESLQTIFSERAHIRTEQLDLELQLKENELRQRHSERPTSRPRPSMPSSRRRRPPNDMKLLGQNATPPEVLEKDLHCHKLELQIKDLKQHIEQMIQLAALQDLENIHVHKMVNLSLPAHSDPRATLSAAGLADQADDPQHQELAHLCCGRGP
ncbi:hypothetical protein NHX12_005779 [Muraenolepis orangiensis]|uniref:Kinesin motor domain-containing protein n=1 Tax=Muraenolepis orangiensis TaxID=630683 RepID=A0A9Q0DRZ6_9TELE|nr:hypothetical protein NHX12_005779 [Muraenolepis orangiensis]